VLQNARKLNYSAFAQDYIGHKGRGNGLVLFIYNGITGDRRDKLRIQYNKRTHFPSMNCPDGKKTYCTSNCIQTAETVTGAPLVSLFPKCYISFCTPCQGNRLCQWCKV